MGCTSIIMTSCKGIWIVDCAAHLGFQAQIPICWVILMTIQSRPHCSNSVADCVARSAMHFNTNVVCMKQRDHPCNGDFDAVVRIEVEIFGIKRTYSKLLLLQIQSQIT